MVSTFSSSVMRARIAATRFSIWAGVGPSGAASARAGAGATTAKRNSKPPRAPAQRAFNVDGSMVAVAIPATRDEGQAPAVVASSSHGSCTGADRTTGDGAAPGARILRRDLPRDVGAGRIAARRDPRGQHGDLLPGHRRRAVDLSPSTPLRRAVSSL